MKLALLTRCDWLMAFSCDVWCQIDSIWQDVVTELEACGHLCRNPQTPGQFIVRKLFASATVKHR